MEKYKFSPPYLIENTIFDVLGFGGYNTMKLHHVAISVPNIEEAVGWYSGSLEASIEYQDETWALLNVENTSIALVLPSQHPPHVAFETSNAAKYGELTPHRDGTYSVYVQDPYGNTVEFLQSTPRDFRS